MAGTRIRGDRIALAGRLAAAWIVAVLALLAIHVFLPQRSGVLALTAVFEPYIVLITLAAVVLAVASRWRPALLLAAAFVAVALVRYVPVLVSLPAPPQGEPVNVVTWNVLAGPDAAARMLGGLGGVAGEADLIGLLELQPPMAQAAISDPALAEAFPYRVLNPDASVYGVGLLSRYPIIEHSSSSAPPYLRVVIAGPWDGVETVVFVVHPLPARIRTLGDVPVALDTARRDADIAHLRAVIETDLAGGRPVIVMGDLNTTQREPAYAEFTAGLRDAHLDAGIGPGTTWRPGWLPSPPFGVLRIDYVLTSPGLRATSSSVDCSVDSDHCVVSATLSR